MEDYRKPYLRLFNGITDALAALSQGNTGQAAALLRQAQADAEELYIEGN